MICHLQSVIKSQQEVIGWLFMLNFSYLYHYIKLHSQKLTQRMGKFSSYKKKLKVKERYGISVPYSLEGYLYYADHFSKGENNNEEEQDDSAVKGTMEL